MNKLATLIREQNNILDARDLIETHNMHEPYYEGTKDNIIDWHTSSLTAIIRNEIERKRGMQREPAVGLDPIVRSIEEDICEGYNTAINEDIAYWENVLEEVEKNN